MLRVRWLASVLLFVFLFTLMAGCSGIAPTPSPTPTATPTPATTTKPEILSAKAGTRVLQSGDAIKPSTVVDFTGQGPADAQIRIYLGTTLVGTTTTGDSGQFTFQWTAGTTEGTAELRFTAKKPDLPESEATTFTLVIDGTGPSIVSGSASADAVGGNPPVITIVFSEPLVINDMAQFTLVPSPYFGIGLTAGSFTLSQISLGADQKTVTLIGTALTDQLPAGASVTVVFMPGGPLTVTDEAGNSCVAPAMITFNVSP